MATLKQYTQAMREWNEQVEFTYPGLQIAVLLTIRDELVKLNRVMQCPNVTKGFRALAKIANNDEAAFKRRVAAAVKKRLARAT